MKPIKEGIKELIFEYFKVDVLEKERLTKDNRENIIETFTYAYNNHLTTLAISKELVGSNLAELRDRIIKRNVSNYRPYPVRLGSLKPLLQSEASDYNKSMHNYILSILKERLDKHQSYIDLHCVPRLNKLYRYKKRLTDLSNKQLAFWY